MTSVLITGVAGFIGFHLARRYLRDGYKVVGVDNLNEYYDVNLKLARLGILESIAEFQFVRAEIDDSDRVFQLFKEHKFEIVVNLAAQAGVRYSVSHPQVYLQSNLIGFGNILGGSPSLRRRD
jgi:UDP-glucuronate 4-epimerase